MDRVVESFPSEQDGGTGEDGGASARPLSLAIVGRPNVGKSTLVNRLLGYERSVVNSAPGTTRDTADSPFTWDGERYTLADTAGIRRKARIADRIERYSIIRALGSVDRGDIVIYLLDGPEGVTSQDAQILAYAFRRGKGLVLAVNKWDLVGRDQRDTKSYSDAVYRKLSFVDFAPLIFISGLAGYGIQKMMEVVEQVAHSYERRIQTSKLNQVLGEIVKKHPAPVYKGREVKFFYATQTAMRPPSFTLFVNSPKGVTEDYQRYLVHQLRPALGLESSPIRLFLRARREEGKIRRGKKGRRER
jgi:GTP-binding protein